MPCLPGHQGLHGWGRTALDKAGVVLPRLWSGGQSGPFPPFSSEHHRVGGLALPLLLAVRS